MITCYYDIMIKINIQVLQGSIMWLKIWCWWLHLAFRPTGIMLRSQVRADDAFGFIPHGLMFILLYKWMWKRSHTAQLALTPPCVRGESGLEQIILRRPHVDSSTFTLLSLESKPHTRLQGFGWINSESLGEEKPCLCQLIFKSRHLLVRLEVACGEISSRPTFFSSLSLTLFYFFSPEVSKSSC